MATPVLAYTIDKRREEEEYKRKVIDTRKKYTVKTKDVDVKVGFRDFRGRFYKLN